MHYLKMNIAGEFFLEIEFDFTGKDTTEARQTYLEAIAAVLEEEYNSIITSKEKMAMNHNVPAVEFYIEAQSRMDFMKLTDFDFKEFEIKLNAARYIKNKLNAANDTTGRKD